MDFPTWRRPGPLETNFMSLLQRAMRGKLFPDIIHHWERVELEQRAMITADWMMTLHIDVLFKLRTGKRSLEEEQTRKRCELAQRAMHSLASTGIATVAAMQGMQDHFTWVAPRADQLRQTNQESYMAFLEQRRLLYRRFEATKLLQRVGRGKLWRVLLHISRVSARDGMTTRSQEWETAFNDLLAARTLVASQFYRQQISGVALQFAIAGASDERGTARAAQKYLQERQQRKQHRQRMVAYLSQRGIKYSDAVVDPSAASNVAVSSSVLVVAGSTKNKSPTAAAAAAAANSSSTSRLAIMNSPRRRAAALAAKKEDERTAVTAFLNSDPCSQVVTLQPAPWHFSLVRDELDERARLVLEFYIAAEQLDRWTLWKLHICALVLRQEHVPKTRVEAEMRKVWRTIECESVALSQRAHMQRVFLARLNEIIRQYKRERTGIRDDLIRRGLLPDEGFWDYDENSAPEFNFDHFKDDLLLAHGAVRHSAANRDPSEEPESESSSMRPVGAGGGKGSKTNAADSNTTDDGGSSVVAAFHPQWGDSRRNPVAASGGGAVDDNTETATLNSMDHGHVVAWDGNTTGDPLRGGDPTKPPLPDGGSRLGKSGAHHHHQQQQQNHAPTTADVLGAAFSRPASAANSLNANNSRPPSGKNTPTNNFRPGDSSLIVAGGGGNNNFRREDSMVVAGGDGAVRPPSGAIVGNPFAGRQPSRPGSATSSNGGGTPSPALDSSLVLAGGGGGGGRSSLRPGRGGGVADVGDMRVVAGGGGSVSATSNPFFSRPSSAVPGQHYSNNNSRPQTSGSDDHHDPDRLHAQDSVFAEILEQKRLRMNERKAQRRNDMNELDDEFNGGGAGGAVDGAEEDEENYDEWSLDSKASIRAGRNYWI